jgi:hypothetical protein
MTNKSKVAKKPGTGRGGVDDPVIGPGGKPRGELLGGQEGGAQHARPGRGGVDDPSLAPGGKGHPMMKKAKPPGK